MKTKLFEPVWVQGPPNSESLKQIIVNDADDISVNKSVTIDDALKQHIKDTEGVLDPYLFEEKINKELLSAQGIAVDLNGYFKPNKELAEKVMRPSLTLNAIIDSM